MSYFGAIWIEIVFVALFILFSTLIYFYYCFTYWQKKHVPYLPGSYPFGNIGKLILTKESFGTTFVNLYKHFRQKGLKYGGFYMMNKPALVLTDPDLIRIVLTKENSSFYDLLGSADEKVDPLAANLFTAKGEHWRNLRKMSSPTFTSGKMKIMFDNIQHITDDLIFALEKPVQTSEPVLIRDIVARLYIDIIGTCVFGIQCNSLKNNDTEFYRYGQNFINTFINNNAPFIFGFLYPKVFQFLGIRRISKEVTDFFMGVLKDTIKTREAQNIKRNDFIDLFIKMKNNEDISDENINKKTSNDENYAVSFTELASQATVFLVAGFEASSQTTMFCLYELALNKSIQDKLREEIIDTVNKCEGQISYEAITEMEYMDKVLKETLRKYPTAPSINRVCTVSYKMPDSDLVIEKDTPVWVSIMGLQRDPEYYPNPDQFDPERFNPEEKEKRHPYTYLPFGEGPKQCIGMRFAYMQIKLALITLLKNYKITLDPKTSVPLELADRAFLLCTKNDVYLQFSKNVY